MKWIVPALLMLAASLCLWHRPSWSRSVQEAPARVIAPSGTYYFLSYFATTTPHGVVGWTPGQEISADSSIKTARDMVAITDGAVGAVVPRVILTQDVATANARRLADEASQERMWNINVALQHANDLREIAFNLQTAKSIERTNAMLVAASTIGAFRSRLNMPAYPASGASGGGYYDDQGVNPPGSGTADDRSPGDPGLLAANDTNTPGSPVDTGATGGGDMAPIVDQAHQEASRERGLGLPPGVIDRMATDAFHLNYFRNAP